MAAFCVQIALRATITSILCWLLNEKKIPWKWLPLTSVASFIKVITNNFSRWSPLWKRNKGRWAVIYCHLFMQMSAGRLLDEMLVESTIFPLKNFSFPTNGNDWPVLWQPRPGNRVITDESTWSKRRAAPLAAGSINVDDMSTDFMPKLLGCFWHLKSVSFGKQRHSAVLLTSATFDTIVDTGLKDATTIYF